MLITNYGTLELLLSRLMFRTNLEANLEAKQNQQKQNKTTQHKIKQQHPAHTNAGRQKLFR